MRSRSCRSLAAMSAGATTTITATTRSAHRALPDPDDHRAVVVKGRGATPAWGDSLTDEEFDAVVRYERERLARP